MRQRTVRNFTPYLSWTDDDIWLRYSEVCSELANLHIELATMKAQEHRLKVNEFWQDQSSSVAARNRAADAAAAETTSSIMECEGRIKSLYEEQQFIEHLVKDYRAANVRIIK